MVRLNVSTPARLLVQDLFRDVLQLFITHESLNLKSSNLNLIGYLIWSPCCHLVFRLKFTPRDPVFKNILPEIFKAICQKTVRDFIPGNMSFKAIHQKEIEKMLNREYGQMVKLSPLPPLRQGQGTTKTLILPRFSTKFQQLSCSRG